MFASHHKPSPQLLCKPHAAASALSSCHNSPQLHRSSSPNSSPAEIIQDPSPPTHLLSLLHASSAPGYYQGPPVMPPPHYYAAPPPRRNTGFLEGCLAALCCCCLIDECCCCDPSIIFVT
ncbi:hypothetical protein KSP40_PGU020976 [Platanthera guangdongensis]|uniref:Cysteine-rich transmembrane domain-containing protein n=1 Tax=Platanthera guangdongensis TaxID=2320717 RepID=A0ABR2MCE9_9ASPA